MVTHFKERDSEKIKFWCHRLEQNNLLELLFKGTERKREWKRKSIGGIEKKVVVKKKEKRKGVKKKGGREKKIDKEVKIKKLSDCT